MKLTKLATVMTMGVSCGYLTQCTTPSHLSNDQKTVKMTQSPSGFVYPHTRTHQEQLDEFLMGEYGMPPSVAGMNNAISDTKRYDDGVDSYIGGVVVDKYRWLEAYDPINPNYAKETDADRERNLIGTRFEALRPLEQNMHTALRQVDKNAPPSEVGQWVDAQNAVSTAYIQSVPFYEQLRQNVDGLLDVETTLKTVKKKQIGELRFYRHPDGFRRIERTDLDGRKIELVNERDLSTTGKSAMRGMSVSKDGSYVSFFVRSGSADSDSYKLHVIDSTTGKLVTPIVNNIPRNDQMVKWIDDKSFYYNAYDTGWMSQIYRRDIGKERFIDELVLPTSHVEDGNIQSIDLEGDDDRYMVLTVWIGGDTVYIKDTLKNRMYRLHDQKFFDRAFANSGAFNNEILAKLVHFDPKTRDVWIISGENNPKGEIIKTNLDNLKERTVVVSPADYDITQEAYLHEEGDGFFVVSYLKDGVSRVVLVDAKTGTHLKDITPAQGAGFASELSGHVVGEEEDDEEEPPIGEDYKENFVSFRYTNPTMPETDYRYSIAKGEFIDVRRHDLTPFDADAYETKLVFYKSYDGTSIPMNISYKKGITLDGKNPTLLYGYGGYGVIYDQIFGFPADTIWLENGGVWAHAFIRGGGEYGTKWQKAAEHNKRLTGYDDFAAAADYLAQAGYADSNHLGIIGGSNGGLLVGAAMTRHPEKYRVAIPEVGVFDMLRHEKAGITSYWTEEYGTPEEGRAMYDYLMSYSPQHNVRSGVCYPSTLVKTSKRDDRVVPSHSYKYAAVLQEHQSCARPVFLYAAEDQGHSPNTFAERKEGDLMVAAFAFNELGVKQLPAITNRPSADELKSAKQLAEEAQEEARKLQKRQQRQTP